MRCSPSSEVTQDDLSRRARLTKRLTSHRIPPSAARARKSSTTAVSSRASRAQRRAQGSSGLRARPQTTISRVISPALASETRAFRSTEPNRGRGCDQTPDARDRLFQPSPDRSTCCDAASRTAGCHALLVAWCTSGLVLLLTVMCMGVAVGSASPNASECVEPLLGTAIPTAQPFTIPPEPPAPPGRRVLSISDPSISRRSRGDDKKCAKHDRTGVPERR